MIKKYLIEISGIFLLLPVIIFFLGFLKIYIGLPMTALAIFIYYRLIKNKDKEIDSNEQKTNKKTIIYYSIVSIIILLWLGFSGVGNFSYQNEDFYVRNAIFRDLVNYDWPVKYNIDNTDTAVEETEYETDDVLVDTTDNLLEGENTVGFVYYCAYWLPSALFGKIFGLAAGNVFIYIWSFLILLLIVALINKKLKKNSIWTIIVLIIFSGLDILLLNDKLLPNEMITNLIAENHIEWGGMCLQYSSNTTLLYWVFNQCIMTWLIVSMIIQIKKPETILFISCLVFCYSPFATFGMIPIAGFLAIKNIISEQKEKSLKNKIISILLRIIKVLVSCEFVFLLGILIIFGTYYMAADNPLTFKGWNWVTNDVSFMEFLLPYLRFILVDFLIYVFLLFKHYKKDGLFYVIVLELLLIPLYRITPANDFCMRSSIAPLFVLCIFIIEYLSNGDKIKDKVIITCMLLIGFVTPMHEIYRSVHHTFTDSRETYIRDDLVYSIGKPTSDYGKYVAEAQFYAKNYKEKFFYKYLAK